MVWQQPSWQASWPAWPQALGQPLEVVLNQMWLMWLGSGPSS